MSAIVIMGLLVQNFAPADQENFPEQVTKVRCLNNSCEIGGIHY